MYFKSSGTNCDVFKKATGRIVGCLESSVGCFEGPWDELRGLNALVQFVLISGALRH